ncbi:TRAP transporter small permease [Neobacillus sp. PS2-9]|uniref:TRAP transporter small permease n=1 Tax=Neobacillus sp. PS2-9 TaxID=3070676 RepID=UPI0027DF3FEC|nr:TRAP transporter small permease [Neobacillus sp. PS2-9]WML57829.1 TRAP transporter small permease [Neobacillus sp. PS2-9]
MKSAKLLITNIEEILSSFLFIIMCTSVALGVFARFFELALVWTDELARYTFIWSVLLGTVVAFKHKKHIAIDLIGNVFSKSINQIIYVLIHGALLILFFTLVKYGWTLTLQTWNVPTTSLQIPTGLIYMSVPLSSFLLIIYTIKDLYQTTFKRDSNLT